MTAIPKTTPVRLKGYAMRKFRFEIFMRDEQRCVMCRCEVSFNGRSSKHPPMHLAHRRNKRMWGDSFENCFTACPDYPFAVKDSASRVVNGEDEFQPKRRSCPRKR